MSKFCSQDLQEYLLVRKLSAVVDGFGGTTSTFTDRTNIWAKVIDRSGDEAEISGRVKATRSIEVVTHYRDDIIETDIIILDGITYNISRIDNIDRKSIYLMIIADNRDE